jgi:hypothetical protein
MYKLRLTNYRYLQKNKFGMKNNITIFLLITGITISCELVGQIQLTYDNFENQIINYEPKQNSNVTDDDYNYGLMILGDIKNGVKNDPANFNLTNYFNVLSAFLTLKESEENIKLAFRKFVDAEGSCDYVVSFESSIRKNKKFDIIIDEYDKQLLICKQTVNEEEELNIPEYCKINNLDNDLVETINRISIADQKYRHGNTENLKTKQKPIDRLNQKSIDSLYIIYKSYIGKKLIGKKFESVMWSVIQHSNIETMERYLPIVHKAVNEDQLGVVPLKMLIDRYYGLKYGYQIFESQSGFGFDIADEKTRNEIKSKYGIE